MFGTLLEVPMWKNCTPLLREAHLQVKMYKARHVWSTFGSSDVEKLHAAVARSTFASENVQNTSESVCTFWTSEVEKCQLASSSVNQSVR